MTRSYHGMTRNPLVISSCGAAFTIARQGASQYRKKNSLVRADVNVE